MRSRFLLFAFAVAVALALFPAVGAQAAAPTLVSVGQVSRHLTATWTLPPGVQAEEVEYSHSSATDFVGEFEDTLDMDTLSATQTSWRSDEALSPGTYWIHVSGSDPACEECEADEWSNAMKVIIPIPPAKTGKYSGRTEVPDSKAISFTLSSNRKHVRGLKVSYDLDCSRGAFPAGELRGTTLFRSPILVHRDLTFARVVHYGVVFRNGPRGSITITVTGKLRPPARATGTLRARAALSGSLRCRNFFGTVAWTALRK